MKPKIVPYGQGFASTHPCHSILASVLAIYASIQVLFNQQRNGGGVAHTLNRHLLAGAFGGSVTKLIQLFKVSVTSVFKSIPEKHKNKVLAEGERRLQPKNWVPWRRIHLYFMFFFRHVVLAFSKGNRGSRLSESSSLFAIPKVYAFSFPAAFDHQICLI